MECHEKLITIVLVTNSGDRFTHTLKAKSLEMLISSWGTNSNPIIKVDKTYINLNNVESITMEC